MRRARLRYLRVGWLVGLLALAGCGRELDAEQARLCRMAVPALAPDRTALAISRIMPDLEPGSVRVEYRAGSPLRAGRVVCRFAASGLQAGKSDLVAIDTEHGPVSGASLYLLRRYYLDAPEATLADPGPPPAERTALPRLPGPLAFGLQLGLGSLPRVAIYGLLAAAYALVFGLVGRINLAFGEIAAVGAAGTGLVSMWLASGALVAAPPILALATLVGIAA
ncbi:MAG: hypothetical protein JO048_02205, partial [Methylobacteriaceae bacterium]|nr:hypothetical protein [Methylobacteriaceae bacterium]